MSLLPDVAVSANIVKTRGVLVGDFAIWGTKGTRLSALAHAVGGCENSPPFLWLKFYSRPSLPLLSLQWSLDESGADVEQKERLAASTSTLVPHAS